MSNIVLFDPNGALTTTAESLKAGALERAALIGAVRNEKENEVAAAAMNDIAVVLKQVESARKKVKEPFLLACQRIDTAAKEFVEELKTEQSRISLLAADWQTEQLERVRAQERARAEEAARIEAEKQAELAKIEAEKRRQEAEARAKAEAEISAARSAKAKAEAEARAKAEQERIAAEAEAAAKQAEELKAQEASMLSPAPTLAKAKGQTVTEKWEWEVTDVWLFARMNPGLIRPIEPNRSEVNEAISRLALTGEPKIPGLRIWKETKVGTRTARTTTINV